MELGLLHTPENCSEESCRTADNSLCQKLAEHQHKKPNIVGLQSSVQDPSGTRVCFLSPAHWTTGHCHIPCLLQKAILALASQALPPRGGCSCRPAACEPPQATQGRRGQSNPGQEEGPGHPIRLPPGEGCLRGNHHGLKDRVSQGCYQSDSFPPT